FLRWNADDREFALGIDPTDVFEAQKLEGTGLSAVGGRALAGKPSKEQHPGLLRRQLQSKLLHTVGECAVEVLGVALVLKRDDEIVHKARQIGFALQVFLGSLLKPEVEHVVQIGSKDGALLHYWSTSPPSALRTGRATPRCTRLASNCLSRSSLLICAIHLDDAAYGTRSRAA